MMMLGDGDDCEFLMLDDGDGGMVIEIDKQQLWHV